MRKTIWLTLDGDVSIAWKKEDDGIMIPLIEEKLKAGYTFFIIDDDGKEERVESMLDIGRERTVILKDTEMQKILTQSKESSITLWKTKAKNFMSKGIAKTAEDVKNNTTLATRPMTGG